MAWLSQIALLGLDLALLVSLERSTLLLGCIGVLRALIKGYVSCLGRLVVISSNLYGLTCLHIAVSTNTRLVRVLPITVTHGIDVGALVTNE